jgi:hypothetical protein
MVAAIKYASYFTIAKIGEIVMAEIYELDAYRPDKHSQDDPPLTRNREILARIQAMWDARTPEQIMVAEVRGTEEELQAVRRKYNRLVQALPPHLWPSEIAKENQGKQIGPEQGKSGRNETANDRDDGHSM